MALVGRIAALFSSLWTIFQWVLQRPSSGPIFIHSVWAGSLNSSCLHEPSTILLRDGPQAADPYDGYVHPRRSSGTSPAGSITERWLPAPCLLGCPNPASAGVSRLKAFSALRLGHYEASQ
ncbi:MAG: hypothetical protein U0800_21300 [Isosphaeraceae bacterium]